MAQVFICSKEGLRVGTCEVIWPVILDVQEVSRIQVSRMNFGAGGALMYLAAGTLLVLDTFEIRIRNDDDDELECVGRDMYFSSTSIRDQSLRDLYVNLVPIMDWIFQLFFNQIVQSQKTLTKSMCQNKSNISGKKSWQIQFCIRQL